jgi:hypothetical protein
MKKFERMLGTDGSYIKELLGINRNDVR